MNIHETNYCMPCIIGFSLYAEVSEGDFINFLVGIEWLTENKNVKLFGN